LCRVGRIVHCARAMWVVGCALWVVRCALCLWVVSCALCVVRCELCVVRCALCVVRCVLSVVRCCALCVVVRCAYCVVRVRYALLWLCVVRCAWRCALCVRCEFSVVCYQRRFSACVGVQCVCRFRWSLLRIVAQTSSRSSVIPCSYGAYPFSFDASHSPSTWTASCLYPPSVCFYHVQRLLKPRSHSATRTHSHFSSALSVSPYVSST